MAKKDHCMLPQRIQCIFCSPPDRPALPTSPRNQKTALSDSSTGLVVAIGTPSCGDPVSRPPSDRAFSPRFPLGYMHGFAGKFARTCRGGREDTPREEKGK